MRKAVQLLLVVLMVASGLPGFAQETPSPVTPDQFERVINFADSIQTLSELVQEQRFDEIDLSRYFILKGTVASTQVYSPDPETFQAMIELVSSRWVGLEEIEVHRIFILVDDPSYAPRLPERLPRDPGPQIIRPNQELLVIGPFEGYGELEPDVLVPVVRAVRIR
ncbi:MAG: hypothetical protein ACOC1I_01480 [Spirochaetota bacterium]